MRLGSKGGLTMDKLKPCPFCGGEAIEKEPDIKAPFNRMFWVIQCQNCYARIGGSHRRMNREAWNRRADDGQTE